MKKVKFLLLMAVALFATSAVNAQIAEPVKWKTEVKALGNNEFLITYTATIDAGWSIYDLGPYEDGPLATSFTIPTNKDVQLVGKITPVVASKKKHDAVWGMEIGKFYTKAQFTQKVKLVGKAPVTFTLNVEWQACDATSCTPPTDEDLSVVLK